MFQRLSVSFLGIGIGLLSVACSSDDKEATTISVSSPAFADGAKIPDEYTCVGKSFPYSGMPPVDHTSPELHWTAGPEGTKSYAIVFRDMTLTTGATIDERGYHWAIFNIPPSVTSIAKGLPSGNPIASIADAEQYSGGLFNNGFLGPCPCWGVAPGAPVSDPPAMVHTDQYTFTVYAMPMAAITKPAMRPAPAMGAPAVSYTKDLDDYFAANALGSAQLKTSSDAQPAMFATPPPAM